MTKLRVHAFSISFDGYGAGPNQDRDNPLGVGGEAMHEWILPTRSFAEMQGSDAGELGINNDGVLHRRCAARVWEGGSVNLQHGATLDRSDPRLGAVITRKII